LLLVSSMGALDVRAAMKSKYGTSNEYPLALLKFVLDKSGVPYTITFADVGVTTQAREIALLEQSNDINIGWFGTSAELERDLVPIRYPIWRGLLGHRVFIISKNNQPAFDRVNTLEDLQKVQTILKELKLSSCEDIILIDARRDNKPSASKA